MVGDRAAVCYKEIGTALRQWIYPTFVSVYVTGSGRRR